MSVFQICLGIASAGDPGQTCEDQLSVVHDVRPQSKDQERHRLR